MKIEFDGAIGVREKILDGYRSQSQNIFNCSFSQDAKVYPSQKFHEDYSFTTFSNPANTENADENSVARKCLKGLIKWIGK